MIKKYNKLIRDKIPEIIEESGSRYKSRILNDEEYKRELLKKIAEEAQEVLEADGDKKELTKEVGDLLEIINYLIDAYGLDRNEIEQVRQERKESRGGFDKKLFLEYTEG
jgi:predicted house-cleaning noncanonical NTP pyrophosphatase (MazG superfamily)